MNRKFSKYGIMAGLPTPFDDTGRFDEKSFRQNVERCLEAGADTVYTTGGAGEFYSLEMDDFKTLVKAYVRATSGWKGNRQIGCSWISTRGVVDRIKCSVDNGIEAVQVTVPFWMALTLDEIVGFFSHLVKSCPQAKLFHYNAAQSKNVLTGKDYARLAKEAPNLVGTKITTPSFMQWMETIILSPTLDHCCCEPLMVPAAMTGAAGVATAWFLANPVWFKGLYQDCLTGRWEEAMRKQVRLHEAYQKMIFPWCQAHGLSDAAIDKALGVAGGFLAGGLNTSNPLKPMDKKAFAKFKAVMEKDFPDLLLNSFPAPLP